MAGRMRFRDRRAGSGERDACVRTTDGRANDNFPTEFPLPLGKFLAFPRRPSRQNRFPGRRYPQNFLGRSPIENRRARLPERDACGSPPISESHPAGPAGNMKCRQHVGSTLERDPSERRLKQAERFKNGLFTAQVYITSLTNGAARSRFSQSAPGSIPDAKRAVPQRAPSLDAKQTTYGFATSFLFPQTLSIESRHSFQLGCQAS